MGLVFFNRPKPRKFDYKPVYYDQEQDEMEERKKELGLLEKGDSHANLKADIRRKWKRGDSTETVTNKAIRSIIYMVILLLSAYLIFFTDFLKNIVSIFSTN